MEFISKQNSIDILIHSVIFSLFNSFINFVEEFSSSEFSSENSDFTLKL